MRSAARVLVAGAIASAAMTFAAPPASAMCSAVLYYTTGHCDVCSLARVEWLECVQ